MKTVSHITAVAALAGGAAAQFNNGVTGSYPSCAQNCISQYSSTSFNDVCQNQAGNIANCVSNAGCSDNDKNNFYNSFAQNCANNGISLSNIAPYNTRYTSTSGFTSLLVAPTITAAAGWNGFPGANGKGPWGAWPTSGSLASAWSSYTSAHPNGPSSGDWASFTSKYSLTSGPWGQATPTGNWANWGSWASGTNGPFGGGSFGGGAGPWGFGAGMGGWKPGMGGPFGGNWGQWASTGSWTAGPWTSWWNGNQCPASTWSGWTSGSWSTSAPWTTWTGCTATPTATSVFTTTVNGVATLSSAYQYRVAQAVAVSTDSAGQVVTGSSRAAAPTAKAMAGGAAVAGLLGVIAAL